MRNYDYTTDTTFATVNGTEMSYDPILKGAKDYFDYVVKCGRMSVEDAQDAMQESALKILKASKGFDDTKSKLGSKYGRRVAQSCFQNALDKMFTEVSRDGSESAWCSTGTGKPETAWQRVTDVFSKYEYEDADGDLVTSPRISSYRSGEFNPESDAVSAENLSCIWNCINSLSATDRLVAEMLIEGKKPREIAREIGCTPDAASIRVYRVRRALEPELKGMLDEFGIRAKRKRCQAI